MQGSGRSTQTRGDKDAFVVLSLGTGTNSLRFLKASSIQCALQMLLLAIALSFELPVSIAFILFSFLVSPVFLVILLAKLFLPPPPLFLDQKAFIEKLEDWCLYKNDFFEKLEDCYCSETASPRLWPRLSDSLKS